MSFEKIPKNAPLSETQKEITIECKGLRRWTPTQLEASPLHCGYPPVSKYSPDVTTKPRPMSGKAIEMTIIGVEHVFGRLKWARVALKYCLPTHLETAANNQKNSQEIKRRPNQAPSDVLSACTLLALLPSTQKLLA